MANYDVVCPIRYPLKCNLSSVEREALQGPAEYTAFFMYQFEGNDPYLKDSITRRLKSPTANLLDASELPGTGIKFCKVCKLILASDFGIAALTPINANVFMEVGMLMGVGKPILYLVNPNMCKSKDLPFDISHEIVIEHTSQNQLDSALQREIPLFREKVRLHSAFKRKFITDVKNKVSDLTEKEREILHFLLLENREVDAGTLNEFYNVPANSDEIRNLCNRYGFMAQRIEQKYDIGNWINVFWYKIHPNYREVLEDLLFKTQE